MIINTDCNKNGGNFPDELKQLADSILGCHDINYDITMTRLALVTPFTLLAQSVERLTKYLVYTSDRPNPEVMSSNPIWKTSQL